MFYGKMNIVHLLKRKGEILLKKLHLFDMFLIAVTCLMGFVLTQTNANASSWHKGTPKVLRGTYQGKRTRSAEGFGYVYKVTQKSFTAQYSNSSPIRIVNLKYKYIKHHVYHFRGHRQHIGMVLGGHEDFVVYLQGNKLLRTSYFEYSKHKMKAFNYDKKNPAKKTKNVKDGGKIVHM